MLYAQHEIKKPEDAATVKKNHSRVLAGYTLLSEVVTITGSAELKLELHPNIDKATITIPIIDINVTVNLPSATESETKLQIIPGYKILNNSQTTQTRD